MPLDKIACEFCKLVPSLSFILDFQVPALICFHFWI